MPWLEQLANLIFPSSSGGARINPDYNADAPQTANNQPFLKPSGWWMGQNDISNQLNIEDYNRRIQAVNDLGIRKKWAEFAGQQALKDAIATASSKDLQNAIDANEARGIRTRIKTTSEATREQEEPDYDFFTSMTPALATHAANYLGVPNDANLASTVQDQDFPIRKAIMDSFQEAAKTRGVGTASNDVAIDAFKRGEFAKDDIRNTIALNLLNSHYASRGIPPSEAFRLGLAKAGQEASEADLGTSTARESLNAGLPKTSAIATRQKMLAEIAADNFHKTLSQLLKEQAPSIAAKQTALDLDKAQFLPKGVTGKGSPALVTPPPAFQMDPNNPNTVFQRGGYPPGINTDLSKLGIGTEAPALSTYTGKVFEIKDKQGNVGRYKYVGKGDPNKDTNQSSWLRVK